jgi:hypothetical protein
MIDFLITKSIYFLGVFETLGVFLWESLIEGVMNLSIFETLFIIMILILLLDISFFGKEIDLKLKLFNFSEVVFFLGGP